MPVYQEYDPISGVILATRVMPEEIARCMMSDGIPLAEGDGKGLTHYVDVKVKPCAVRKKGEEH